MTEDGYIYTVSADFTTDGPLSGSEKMKIVRAVKAALSRNGHDAAVHVSVDAPELG
jgi:hypothetical protein